MSWHHARAVLDIEGMKPNAKLVLLAIGLRAGTDGRAWPSVATICKDTGLSDRGVRLLIQDLHKAELLRVTHRPGATLLLELSAALGADLARQITARSAANDSTKRGTSPRIEEVEVRSKRASAGSTAMRPADATNGNGRAHGWISTASRAVWVELDDGTVVPGAEP